MSRVTIQGAAPAQTRTHAPARPRLGSDTTESISTAPSANEPPGVTSGGWLISPTTGRWPGSSTPPSVSTCFPVGFWGGVSCQRKRLRWWPVFRSKQCSRVAELISVSPQRVWYITPTPEARVDSSGRRNTSIEQFGDSRAHALDVKRMTFRRWCSADMSRRNHLHQNEVKPSHSTRYSAADQLRRDTSRLPSAGWLIARAGWCGVYAKRPLNTVEDQNPTSGPHLFVATHSVDTATSGRRPLIDRPDMLESLEPTDCRIR